MPSLGKEKGEDQRQERKGVGPGRTLHSANFCVLGITKGESCCVVARVRGDELLRGRGGGKEMGNRLDLLGKGGITAEELFASVGNQAGKVRAANLEPRVKRRVLQFRSCPGQREMNVQSRLVQTEVYLRDSGRSPTVTLEKVNAGGSAPV